MRVVITGCNFLFVCHSHDSHDGRPMSLCQNTATWQTYHWPGARLPSAFFDHSGADAVVLNVPGLHLARSIHAGARATFGLDLIFATWVGVSSGHRGLLGETALAKSVLSPCY